MIKFLTFLSGPSGKTSSIRVNTFLALVVTLGLAVYCTATDKKLPELSSEWVAILLGPLGLQVWHKGKESDKESEKKLS